MAVRKARDLKVSPYLSPHWLIMNEAKDACSFRFQILVKSLIVKTTLIWIIEEDYVVALKLLLKHRLGIPSTLQCLFHGGKLLRDSSLLKELKISRNSTIVLGAWLLGGAVGVGASSTSKSYKEAARSKVPPNTTNIPIEPSPYI